MKRYLKILYPMLKAMAKEPSIFTQAIKTVPSICSAYEFSRAFENVVREVENPNSSSTNPLWEYFQNHKEGFGIWKWEHYFDIYHRHLAKFVGQKVDVLEIGIYSGGSLEMWRSYFGENSHIYGVDIEEVCKAYENEHVSVFIGDQADRSFWSTFKNSVKGIDILIDDGGHTPEQQQITLEEMLPHLRPGGVYLCEDVHGTFNRFSAFATGLVNELNSMNVMPSSLLQSRVTQFQSAIHSIHFYPYLVVIEKHPVSLPKLSAPKHGTQWQPFL
ncbi:hypothetical protein NIES25_37770 [Nostoc linckia NIES-25]|nr:hypothetical protein NIES25_37770 [Nostoc linckia NIES-25]